MDLARIRAWLESLDTLASRAYTAAQSALNLAGVTAGKLLGVTRIQAGTATLVNGVTAAIPVTFLDANTTIVVGYHTLNGNANTVMLTPTNRTPGTPGSFQIEALAAGGAGNVADQSSVDWHLIQP